MGTVAGSMDYGEAERYVLSFTDYEKTPGILYTSTTYDLKRVERLLERLGSPHLGPVSVHVAGTKGKGSTTAMIASALTAAGYTTGLYTSPHFFTMRERIRVDGRMIGESEFAAATGEVKPHVEELNRGAGNGGLTTFEVLTAVAFVHFASKGVQCQALEVGLGGRLDATNVVRPAVCVITSISLDHVEVLGSTLEQIAAEKAGIIKPGCVVVSAPQQGCVADVVSRTCREKGTTLVQVGKDISWHSREVGGEEQSFSVTTRKREYRLTLPLLGEHQMENAACAVAALEVMSEHGTPVAPDAVARGLASVRWPGRLQVLRRGPWLVCDGAHNADSAAKLLRALARHFHPERMTLVMGTNLDKDIPGMVRELAPAFHSVVVTRSAHPRSADTSCLSREFAAYGVVAREANTVAGALALAMQESGTRDLVCITGSLFVVGEALAWANAISAEAQ